MSILTYNIGEDPFFSGHSGTVFSRSRSGQVARARAKPSHAHTSRREIRKGSICRSGKRWLDSLSAGQRSAWSTLGASTTWTNPIGNNYNPSGFNLYVRTNSLRDFYGLGWIDTAPAAAVCTAYNKIFSFTPGVDQLFVSGSQSTPDAYRSFFDISPPLRRTIYSYRDPYTFNAQGSGVSLKADMELGVPGQFDESDWINIRWRDMAADGSLSDPSYPFFLLEDSDMITYTATLEDFSFDQNNTLEYLYQGIIELNISETAIDARHHIPVDCRLRHIGLRIYTGVMEGDVASLLFQVVKNGVFFHQRGIAFPPVSNHIYSFSETSITEKPFSRGDDVVFRLVAQGTGTWDFTVSNCIVSLMFQIGDFS